MNIQFDPTGPYAICMAHAERGFIQTALDQYDGDFDAAANALRVSEEFLRVRVHVLGIELAVVQVVDVKPESDQVTLPITSHAFVAAETSAPEIARPKPMVSARPRVAVAQPAATPELTPEQREELARALLEDADDDAE